MLTPYRRAKPPQEFVDHLVAHRGELIPVEAIAALLWGRAERYPLNYSNQIAVYVTLARRNLKLIIRSHVIYSGERTPERFIELVRED